MLNNKKDIYDHYTEENFEAAFKKCFKINSKETIVSSGRILYLMVKHEI